MTRPNLPSPFLGGRTWEGQIPGEHQAACRAVWDWQERAVSFSWAGCCRKAPSPCLPRLLPYSSLFLPSTRSSSTFLQPRDVLSAGDEVLFRLLLLCNMPMKLPFYIDFLHLCMNLSLTALSCCSYEKFQIVAPGKFIQGYLYSSLGRGKRNLSMDLISLDVGI